MGFKFPTAYTILFVLIVVVAGLTWVVPAGKYEMARNEKLGKEGPVAGSYHEVERNPQGFVDIFMAPVSASGKAAAPRTRCPERSESSC